MARILRSLKIHKKSKTSRMMIIFSLLQSGAQGVFWGLKKIFGVRCTLTIFFLLQECGTAGALVVYPLNISCFFRLQECGTAVLREH